MISRPFKRLRLFAVYILMSGIQFRRATAEKRDGGGVGRRAVKNYVEPRRLTTRG